MVLQTERYPGGYHQNNYSAYQRPNGSYSSYHDVSEHSSPFSSYSSSHAQQQSGWSTGGDYPTSGSTHYPGGGMVAPMKPTTGGYGRSHGYGNSHSHGSHGHENSHSHGSQYGLSHGSHSHGNSHSLGSQYGQSHGSPHGNNHVGPLGQGYGGPHNHGHGSQHGYGAGVTSPFDKLTNGLHGYGSGNHNYGPTSGGLNHGYQKQPSWTLKSLDDDDD